jgi:hypothetical protein
MKMKTRNFTQIISLFVLIGLLFSGCDEDPIDVAKGTDNAKQVYTSGFSLTTESNMMLNSNIAIKNSDIMNIIDEHDYFAPGEFDSLNIYVDMSAGLAPQIQKSEDELRLVVQRFSEATFYGVGGKTGKKAKDAGIPDQLPEAYQPEDLTQKIKESEKNPTSYFCSKGSAAQTYNHNNSFLRSAVNACIYSDIENKTINSNANLFITDFYLDEGGSHQDYGSHYGSATNANPTGWASEQFEDWFRAGNRLDIIAKKTTIHDGQYGSQGYPSNDKYLYFLFFTPREYFKSAQLSRLLKDLKNMPDVDYLSIDPFSYAIELTDESGPGTDLSYTYINAKKRNPDIYNVVLEDGQEIEDKYQVQFLPFSISMLKDIKEREEGFTLPFKNFDLINNFDLQDRNDKESCPYRIKMKANFYQINSFIYELSGINMKRVSEVPYLTFDPDNYPGNLKNLTSLRKMPVEPNAFVFTDSTIQISGNVLNTSDALHAIDPSKIYLCDIVADEVYFDMGVDEYDYDFLEWKHKNHETQVNVKCLKESINEALGAVRKQQEGNVIYSYLIGINK